MSYPTATWKSLPASHYHLYWEGLSQLGRSTSRHWRHNPLQATWNSWSHWSTAPAASLDSYHVCGCKRWSQTLLRPFVWCRKVQTSWVRSISRQYRQLSDRGRRMWLQEPRGCQNLREDGLWQSNKYQMIHLRPHQLSTSSLQDQDQSDAMSPWFHKRSLCSQEEEPPPPPHFLTSRGFASTLLFSPQSSIHL